MEGIHPIGLVVQKTGLSAHVLRAWERRYGAIAPVRSDGNQRLYSDKDIQRLTLLAKAIKTGASISRISKLSEPELLRLVLPDEPKVIRANSSHIEGINEQARIKDALKYIEMSDSGNLRKELSSWLMSFGVIPVIERFVPSLMEEIGKNWSESTLRVHQEHMATEVVRNFLGNILDDIHVPAGSRKVITGTPPGETHEIGALLCALAAETEGLDVTHLGSDVPFPEIIHLSYKLESRAIMLSIVFDSQDMFLVQGLRSLRDLVSPETKIYIGGRSAGWYAERVSDVNIETITSINEMRIRLRELN
jgi:MerR family transcriptional regulator, light-induced transcriptional regulator